MTSLSQTIASKSIPIFSAVRHQPVARKSAAVRLRYVRHVATLMAIGVVLMLFYVWIRIQVISLGYEVSRIRKETTDLKEQKSLLEAEVLSLKVPARLEGIAVERFGMRLPQSDEVVLVEP